MKADISRDTFQAARDIRRVIVQQGRPWLDADWNEQVSVLLHRLETLAADIFGEYAGIGDGFKVELVADENAKPLPNTFGVARGRYYVHGLMCENDGAWSPPHDVNFKAGKYLVYVHAWEEYESGVEDPAIIEPALRGVDTTGRTRVRWDVEWTPVTLKGIKKEEVEIAAEWEAFKQQPEAPAANLGLRVKRDPGGRDASRMPASAAYRGLENTLYRVEVHSVDSKSAYLKVGRNNASSVVAVSAQGSTLTCHSPGTLDQSFQANGWLEVSSGPASVAQPDRRQLCKADVVDREAGVIQLAADPPSSGDNLFARSWLAVHEVPLKDRKLDWIPLDDGLEFSVGVKGTLRPGQHWMIPIRTDGGGQVYWPVKVKREIVNQWVPLDDSSKNRLTLAPVEPDLSSHGNPSETADGGFARPHYYGLLALIEFADDGKATIKTDLRKVFAR